MKHKKLTLQITLSRIAQSRDLDRTIGTNLGNDPLEAMQSFARDVAWTHHRPSPAFTMIVRFRRKITKTNFVLGGPGVFR